MGYESTSVLINMNSIIMTSGDTHERTVSLVALFVSTSRGFERLKHNY